MAIQFGSGVFWVRFCRRILQVSLYFKTLHLVQQHNKQQKSLAAANERHIVSVLFATGGSAGHEHQADGPNEEETGVHGSSPVKQICPRCLLVTIFVCIQYQIITIMLEFAHIKHMLYTII